MAPMPLTGTIGATVPDHTLLSSRRALPDQVTCFALPTIERPNVAAKAKTQTTRGRKSRDASKKEEAAVAVVEEDESGLLDVEQSLVLLQSLRQSRLAHLTALLPYLSTRHRTSTRYHAPPQDYPFPGGLDASVQAPTLLHLGRADVRVGPLVFPNTRFGEARVEGGVQDAEGAAMLKGTPSSAKQSQQQTTSSSSPSKPQQQQQQQQQQPTTTTVSSPAAVKPTTSTNVPTTPVSKVKSTVPSSSASHATPSHPAGAATAAPTAPIAAPPDNPSINDKVVKAVSAAAQNDQALQRLLHAAANGKATPEQLRELAAFIAKISEAIEKAEKATATAAAAAAAQKSNSSSAVSTPVKPTTPKVRKKKKENAVEKDTQMSSPNNRQIPAPLHATTPPYPPIVTVEYRENPSARFILPLWRDAVVERRTDAGVRSIKVTMLLPAIGSSAALRAAGQSIDDQTSSDKKPKKQKGKAKAKQATEDGQDAKEATPATSFSPMNPPSKEDLKKHAPPGAEAHAVTWLISGTTDTPLSDGIWHVFGRVDGAQTFEDGVPVTDDESQQDKAVVSQQVLLALVAKLRALPAEQHDTMRMPKLRVTSDEVSRDLSDQLTDRFAPRLQTLAVRPVIRFKRGAGEEDGGEHFEMFRGVVSATDSAKRKYGRTDDGDDDDEGVAMGDDTMTPVKRKRHVAKYNPDGTLKLCQACGTNVTPMWRRGPAGKSSLCNACGAKWKVGRLVVPDVPPTVALDVEEKKKKVVEGQSSTEKTTEKAQTEQPKQDDEPVVEASLTTEKDEHSSKEVVSIDV